MADISALAEGIKRLAVSAVEAGKPCDILIGTVKSEKPLEISIDQKLILGEGQLILSRAVTDYEISLETEWNKEVAAVSALPKNAIEKIKIPAALKAGERVALIRLSGGQNFYVADRLG